MRINDNYKFNVSLFHFTQRIFTRYMILKNLTYYFFELLQSNFQKELKL